MKRNFPRRSQSGVLLLSLVVLSIASQAHAYVTNGKSWPANSTLTFQLSLGNAPSTLSDGNISWNAAAAPAIDAWNERIAGLQITKVMDSPAALAQGDRVNSVAFSTTVFGQSFGTGTLAVTYYFTQGSTFLEADVLFNRAQTFDSYRGPLRFGGPGGYATGDIRRVLMHELGHGLGLEHASGDNIMSPITSNRETLSGDDLAGIQSIYGAAIPPPSPPTPTPAPMPNYPNDFNSDLKADLVWQNNVTGQRAIWLMNGTTKTGQLSLPAAATTWNIASTADFNHDGQTDLLWQNKLTGQGAVWLLSGNAVISSLALPTTSILWQVAATGDFNADGKADIVWQNTVTGQRSIWLMNGTTYIGQRSLPTASAAWSIVATDDFNGDGQLDLVWQNSITGQRALWFLNGSSVVSTRALPTIAVQWQIVGSGDYNGDGHPDLIWQNTLNGQRLFWLMNGSTRIGTGTLPAATTTWEIRNH